MTVGPITGHFFVVLESDFDSLTSVNANSFEVELVWLHGELGDGNISDKVDGVLWTILDVDWD